MHIYSAKVKLGGLLTNEVRKTGITAAEIMILRAVHGDDAVSEIVQTGTVNRSDAKERQRLIGSVGDSIPLYRTDQYRKVFQNDFNALPQVVSEPVDEEDEEEMDLTDEEVIPVDVMIAEGPKPDKLAKARAALAAKKAAREAASTENALA